jgi:hypothetical protein
MPATQQGTPDSQHASHIGQHSGQQSALVFSTLVALLSQHASVVSQQGSPSAQHSVAEEAAVSFGAVPIENKEMAAIIRPPDSFKYMQCSPRK